MSKFISMFVALMTAANAVAQINVFTPDDFAEGDLCDTMRYIVYYDMSFVADTTRQPCQPVHETMRLELGDSISSFYSYRQFQADSVNAVVMEKGGNEYQGGGRIAWRLYVNYPAVGQTTLLEKFGIDRFVCVENADEPCWMPVADSVSVFLGYGCRLAKAVYKGRTWYAWYAEDIPIASGPWKLGGLPGLILYAYDGQNHYSFMATRLENAARGSSIYYKGTRYEAIDRNTLDGVCRRYHADPVGYVANNPKVKVSVKDKAGNDISRKVVAPYNPIERR